MPESQKSFTDEATYRKLSEPFESKAVMSDAYEKFFDELYELRCKHKIMDVLVVCRSNALGDDGEEGTLQVSFHLGDSMNSEAMAAYAYGDAVSKRQDVMAKYLSGIMSKPKGRK